MTEEEKKETKKTKLPLDARLLSDAVIELNISRRNVGMYPPEHPFIKGSIEKAFSHLQQIFQIRHEITLGIAKNTLVVDEYTIGKNNPVFMEFASNIHFKGIAAVTFSSGLTEDELIIFHELITSKESQTGKALVESEKCRNLRHISITPIDFSFIGFDEGVQRTGRASGNLWEDYVYGLMEGKLSAGDGDIVLTAPPEVVAGYVNAAMSEISGDETKKEDENEAAYNRVITSYIKKQGEARISKEAFYKFFSFVDHLKPELKRQFLTRASTRLTDDIVNVESVIRDMTPESFDKISGLFANSASLIPDALKNLMDKLSSLKQSEGGHFDYLQNNSAVRDDIELGNDIINLFNEDNLPDYASEDYQLELNKMLSSSGANNKALLEIRLACEEELIDATALDVILELIDADFLKVEDYLNLLTKLSDYINLFIETGRFELVLDAYNVLSSHSLNGKFMREASSTLEYFFHSEEFIEKLINAFRLWGRKDREAAIRLAKAFKRSIMQPLFDVFADEPDATMRKFFITMLQAIGSDVLPHAVSRLSDNRWYVVRNMIYVIRECNGYKEVDKVRKFLKHENANVCLETVKTLLHFKTPDALSSLRYCLQSDNPDVRNGAVKLAGLYSVKDAVPFLIKFLDKKEIAGAEVQFKSDVIKALGEIGDIKALEPLKNIINTNSFFFKGNLDSLKIEIYRTLDAYPPDSVKDLVKTGLASKNEKIRALSEKLQSGRGKTVDQEKKT